MGQQAQQVRASVPQTVWGNPVGMKHGSSNVNINDRPIVPNPQAGPNQSSTLWSTSFGTDQGEVLVPRVTDGEDGKPPHILSDKRINGKPSEAEAYYQKYGKTIGIFDTPEHATAYAQQLHEQQAALPNINGRTAPHIQPYTPASPTVAPLPTPRDVAAQGVPMEKEGYGSIVQSLLLTDKDRAQLGNIHRLTPAEEQQYGQQKATTTADLESRVPRLIPRDVPLTAEEQDQVAVLKGEAAKGNIDPTRLTPQQRELLTRNWRQSSTGIPGAVAKAVRDKLSDFSRLDQAALIATMPESKLVSLYFGGQMARGVIQETPEAWKAYQAGDHEKAAALATSAIIDGAMAGMAARHAVKGGVEGVMDKVLPIKPEAVAEYRAQQAATRVAEAVQGGGSPSEINSEGQRRVMADAARKPPLHATNDVEALRASAERQAPHIGDAVEAATEGVPGANLKAVRDSKDSGRIINKTEEQGVAPSQIGDIAAAKVTVPDQAAADHVLRNLDQTMPVESVNGTVTGEPGKNAVRQTQAIVNTEGAAREAGVENEPVKRAEVLIQTPEMERAAEATHDDYRKAQELRQQGKDAEAEVLERKIIQQHEAAEQAARTRQETANAVPEQGAGGVLQRPPQEAGATGGERGGVEPGQQGAEAPAARPEATREAQVVAPEPARGVQGVTLPVASEPAISEAQKADGVVRMPVSDITLDPQRFQYKMNTDRSGVTNLLKGRKWNNDLAGVVSVWKDPETGKTYAVNGHHRLQLAQENGVPDIDVKKIDAPTAAAARAVGALQNIAEGRGTAMDAAKFFRDSGFTPEKLDDLGISMGEATAANGVALSRLDPSLFDQVVSGKLRQGRAIAIGNATADAADQEAIVKLIQKREAKGGKVTDDVVDELARMVKGAQQTTETQQGLFGAQEMTRSLALEKAEISSAVRDRIAQERRTFQSVADTGKAAMLGKVEGQQLKPEENARIARDAAQAQEIYDRLSTRGGTIDDILNRAARELADGGNANGIKQRAYDDIRAELSKAVPGGADSGRAGVQEAAQARPAGRPPIPPTRRAGAERPAAAAAGAGSAERRVAWTAGRQSTPVEVRGPDGEWRPGTLEHYNPGWNGNKASGRVTLDDAARTKVRNVPVGEMRLPEPVKAGSKRYVGPDQRKGSMAPVTGSDAEKANINYTKENLPKLVDQYLAKHSVDGVATIATDAAKEMYSDFQKDPTRAERDVHTSAAAVASAALNTELAAPVKAGKDMVDIVTASPGSGKTFTQSAEAESRVGLRVEDIMTDPKDSSILIDKILASGRRPVIRWIYVDDPKTTVNRMVMRAVGHDGKPGIGRTVNVDYMAKAYTDLPKTLLAMMDKYGDQIGVQGIDNSGAKGSEKLLENTRQTLEEMKQLKQDEVAQQMQEELKALKDKGVFDGDRGKAIYAAAEAPSILPSAAGATEAGGPRDRTEGDRGSAQAGEGRPEVRSQVLNPQDKEIAENETRASNRKSQLAAAVGRDQHENAAAHKSAVVEAGGRKHLVLDADGEGVWHRLFGQIKDSKLGKLLGARQSWTGMTLTKEQVNTAIAFMKAVQGDLDALGMPDEGARAGYERMVKLLKEAQNEQGGASILRGDYRGDTAREEAAHQWQREHGLDNSYAMTSVADQPEFAEIADGLRRIGYREAKPSVVAMELMAKAMAGDPAFKIGDEERVSMVRSFLTEAVEEKGPGILQDLPETDPRLKAVIDEVRRGYDYGDEYNQGAAGRSASAARGGGGQTGGEVRQTDGAGPHDRGGGRPIAEGGERGVSEGGAPQGELTTPLYRDFEDYAAQHDAGRQGYGDPALSRSNSSTSHTSWKAALKNQDAKDAALTERREALRQDYSHALAAGEIREMTESQRLARTAAGHPDNEAVQAAQRILEKRAQQGKPPIPPAFQRARPAGYEPLKGTSVAFPGMEDLVREREEVTARDAAIRDAEERWEKAARAYSAAKEGSPQEARANDLLDQLDGELERLREQARQAEVRPRTQAEETAGRDRGDYRLSHQQYRSAREGSRLQPPKPPPSRALPGMEGADAERAQAEAEQQGRELTERLREPGANISKKAGQMERESPLFFGTGAGGQDTLFQRTEEKPNEKVVDMLTRGKTGAYTLDHWLKNQPGVKILSIEREAVDPAKLTRLQDWTREGKLADWKRSNVSAKDFPAAEVVRTAGGDVLYEGTHRAEYAKRQGEQLPAKVYTIQTRDDAPRSEGSILFQRAVEDKEANRQNPWFLKSARILGEKMKGPMPGDALVRMLENNGVKAEELKWSGLEELRGRPRVTPAEVQQHLAENTIKVEEVTKGDHVPKERPQVRLEASDVRKTEHQYVANDPNTGREFQVDQGYVGSARIRAAHYLTNLMNSRALSERSESDRSSEPKYGTYTLPGGENYREKLLILSDPASRAKPGTRAAMGLERGQSFHSGHWAEDDVLAHIRFNDRTAPDGKKLLHIEEIQSDWHQKGRARGYKTPEAEEFTARYKAANDLRSVTAADSVAAFNRSDNLGYDTMGQARSAVLGHPDWAERWDVTDPRDIQSINTWRDARLAEQALEDERTRHNFGNSVPDAPFKKDWHEMAFRRAVKYAADNGYDGVSWTPGEEQAKRYYLSKQINDITLNGRGDDLDITATDLNHRRVMDSVKTTRDGLADIIGKEAAQKLLDQPEPDPNNPYAARFLHNADLRVGGEGMKGFYDKMLPDYARKFGKQWGAKVGETFVDAPSTKLDRGYDIYRPGQTESYAGPWDTAEEAAQHKDSPNDEVRMRAATKVPVLDITPEMRKAVGEQGVSMFQKSEDKEYKPDWVKEAQGRGEWEPMPRPERTEPAEEQRPLPLGGPSVWKRALGAYTDWRDEAPNAGSDTRELLRDKRGQMDRSVLQLKQSLGEMRKDFEGLAKAKTADMIDSWEHGRFDEIDPKHREQAKVLYNIGLDDWHALEKLDPEKFQNFLQNHYPHIWDRSSPGYAKVFGKQGSIFGNKKFLQPREIRYFKTALDYHLEPKSWNPVDAILERHLAIRRYIFAQDTIQQMRGQGLLRMFKSPKDAPADWTQINDRFATVTHMNADGERVLDGHYYAPDAAAKSFNNFVSQGLIGRNAMLDAAFDVNRSMNATQLALSAFHATASTVNLAIGDISLGLEEALQGRGLSAAKHIARGVSTVGPVARHLYVGNKVLREYYEAGARPSRYNLLERTVAPMGEYLNPGSAARYQAEVNWITRSGWRPEQALRLDAPRWKQVTEDIRRGDWFKGAKGAVPATIDLAGSWLMRGMIPRIKAGTLQDMTANILAEATRRGWDDAEIRRRVQDASDSVDYRYGQMIYDNRFWNKTAQHLAQLGVRSVGWQSGTYMEYGGAVTDTARAFARAAARRRPELTHKMAFSLATPIFTGMFSAAATYLMTGHAPDTEKHGLKAYAMVETPDGTMLSIPGYTKNLMAVGEDVAQNTVPWRTAFNFASPGINVAAEMMMNSDYYGRQIRNEDDPWFSRNLGSSQAGEYAKYIASKYVPFSIESMQRQRQNAGGGEFSDITKKSLGLMGLLGYAGFQPATKIVQNSSAMNLAEHYMQENPEAPRTREQAEHSESERNLVQALRAGNLDDRKLNEALVDGKITEREFQTAQEEAFEPPLERMAKRLSLQQNLQIWKKATPEERAALQGVIGKKANEAYVKDPASMEPFEAELNDVMKVDSNP
jgi:hypothetical protein